MNTQSILRMREILKRLSISRSTLYVLVKAGKFPRQISIGARSVGWLETDVNKFIDSRVCASRKGGVQ